MFDRKFRTPFQIMNSWQKGSCMQVAQQASCPSPRPADEMPAKTFAATAAAALHCRARLWAMAAAALMLGLAVQSASASVAFSGFQQRGTGSQYYLEDLATVFQPNTEGVVITGTLDINEFLSGDTLMLGIIDKKHRDNNGYVWQSGAYLYLTVRSDNTLRFGVTDGNLFGAIVSGTAGTWASINPRVNTIDFELTIADGDIALDSSLLANPLTWTYGAIETLNNAYGYAWGEFEFGAYLGTSMFWNGAQTAPDRKYGVESIAKSAAESVPEPGTLALAGLALAGLAASRRRQK